MLVVLMAVMMLLLGLVWDCSRKFFPCDRLVKRSVSRRSVREHAERQFGIAWRGRGDGYDPKALAERSRGNAFGGGACAPLRFPAPPRMGMAGHVPLSGLPRSEAEGPSPPVRNAPGRVGSGGFRGRKMMGAGHSIDGNVRPPFDAPAYQSACRPRLSSAFR